KIDDVEIFEALRLECLRLRRRIAMKHRRARHVALLEPHAGAVLEIDGRKEDHGRSLSTKFRGGRAAGAHGVHFRKLAISRKPSRWLLWGWTGGPPMGARPTPAVPGPP